MCADILPSGVRVVLCFGFGVFCQHYLAVEWFRLLKVNGSI